MKKFFRKIVLWKLKFLAKKRLKKFRGKIIAVTGSVGKTSTKDAIYTVLNSQFKVKKSEKSMNSEFGLLLTILDIESGFSSATKWAWLLMKAFVNSFKRDYSEILLLELGVDTPGDMDFLTSVIQPDIAVMTNIFAVHMGEGQFSSLEEIFEEKKKLVDALKEGGVAILNIDNPYLKGFSSKRSTKNTVTFGKEKSADYFIEDLFFIEDEGLAFKMTFQKEPLNLLGKKISDEKLKGAYLEVQTSVLGEYQVYVLSPAIICGVLMGMQFENILTSLQRYTLPPGRMSLISGKDSITLIDSSYNSSPEALKEALKVLKFAGGESRTVAVLGSMNELGENSKKMHEKIGEVIPEFVDLLITVGNDAKYFSEKAIKEGMEEKSVINCKNVKEAEKEYEKILKAGDVVLVKGSQNNVRLEKFVKTFMKHPEDADKLLVRQEKEWKSKN